MTAIYIVLAILVFWGMYACVWVTLRYSGRVENRRLKRIEDTLDAMDDRISGELSERNRLLRILIETLER